MPKLPSGRIEFQGYLGIGQGSYTTAQVSSYVT